MKIFWIIFGAVCAVAGIIGLLYLRTNTPRDVQRYKAIKGTSLSGLIFGILIIILDIIMMSAVQ